MIERILNDFDIDQIANSGQCFRFHRVGDKSYNLIAGTHLLNIQQNGRTVRFDCDEDEFNAIWRPYFDLDADYGRCKAAVAKRDTYLQNAVAYGGGLRILRQDLWETILCFIISQQNNIARITKCVENLCSLFGETCYNKSEQVYNSIPTAERLAACTPEDLAPVRRCRMYCRPRQNTVNRYCHGSRFRPYDCWFSNPFRQSSYMQKTCVSLPCVYRVFLHSGGRTAVP